MTGAASTLVGIVAIYVFGLSSGGGDDGDAAPASEFLSGQW